MFKIALELACVASVGGHAAGADVFPDQIDRLFARFQKPDSPGCALAVVRDGQVVYENGYGMANLDDAAPITPSTVFHIASVSKQFTSFAIALLAAEGKLSLDDDVRRYVPEVPDFGARITLRHLLNHTSGLRDQWSLLVLAGWRMEDVITEADVLDLVHHQRELNFPPGERFLYSNTGYTLLAMVVQRVSGRSLRTFAEAEMFEPLMMTSTHFHDDHRMIVKQRARSYAPKGDHAFEEVVLSYATVGATSLFTTVGDLALWQQNFAEHTVGSAALMAAMLEPGKLNDGTTLSYAAGLELGSYRGLKTIGHGGGDAGFRAYLVRFPDQDFAIALLGNAGHLDAQGLAYRVADLYLADAFTEPPAAPEAAAADPTAGTAAALEPLAGLYLNRKTGELWQADVVAGALTLRGAGASHRLTALGPNRFSAKRGDGRLEVEFLAAAAGQRPDHIRLRLPGSPQDHLERVQPAPSGTDHFWQYTGEYRSDELDSSYRVSVNQGKLVLSRRKYGEQPLVPIYQDAFQSDGFAWEFTRDAQGHVNGGLANTGRVVNLRFHRLP
ncbi:MAG: serine hydrolase domain-containing protein [Planctomycetota bacterium]